MSWGADWNFGTITGGWNAEAALDGGEGDRDANRLGGGAELGLGRDAPPCALMTKIIGRGARPALKKLAGIYCRVIQGGTIRVGDELVLGRPINP